MQGKSRSCEPPYRTVLAAGGRRSCNLTSLTLELRKRCSFADAEITFLFLAGSPPCCFVLFSRARHERGQPVAINDSEQLRSGCAGAFGNRGQPKRDQRYDVYRSGLFG
jgi:hypothetical protein